MPKQIVLEVYQSTDEEGCSADVAEACGHQSYSSSCKSDKFHRCVTATDY